MNKSLYLGFLFVFLLLLQVFILNNILLFGHVNPFIYIVFVFVYPFYKNRFPFLTYAFLLGLFVDFFSDTGGVNAFATLFIAYIRLYFFKRIFQKSESEYEFFNLRREIFGNVFNYVVILTVIHHFLVFSLINFSVNNFSNVLINAMFSAVFTLILYFLGNFIFSRKQ